MHKVIAEKDKLYKEKERTRITWIEDRFLFKSGREKKYTLCRSIRNE